MLIYNFIKALLPRLDKERLTEDLRVTLSELDNNSIPNYFQASEYLKTNKPKSDKVTKVSDGFYKNFDLQKSSKQSTFVGDINKRLGFVRDNVLYIKEQSETILEADIISEGLTAKKAVLIRASEAFTFISRYSLDLLNYVLVKEAIKAKAEIAEDIDLSPATAKFVENNINKFARLLSDYGIPKESFTKLIGEVPDILINSKTITSIQGIYKDRDLDPFTYSHVSGFTGNPIYHLRLLVAEWQSNRYKASKEKKQVLELRLLHLKMLKENKDDPKLQHEINYTQSRIDSLDQYLQSVDKDLEEKE